MVESQLKTLTDGILVQEQHYSLIVASGHSSVRYMDHKW